MIFRNRDTHLRAALRRLADAPFFLGEGRIFERGLCAGQRILRARQVNLVGPFERSIPVLSF